MILQLLILKRNLTIGKEVYHLPNNEETHMERLHEKTRIKEAQSTISFTWILDQVLNKWVKRFFCIFQSQQWRYRELLDTDGNQNQGPNILSSSTIPAISSYLNLLYLGPNYHDVKTSYPHWALPILLNHKLVDTIKWLFYAIKFGVACFSAIDWRKIYSIPKPRFSFNRHREHVTLALGSGRKYKHKKGKNNDNVHELKQPFVPYIYFNNIMIVSFKSYGNFLMTNLSWNYTGKWILENVISTYLNWFKIIACQ